VESEVRSVLAGHAAKIMQIQQQVVVEKNEETKSNSALILNETENDIDTPEMEQNEQRNIQQAFLIARLIQMGYHRGRVYGLFENTRQPLQSLNQALDAMHDPQRHIFLEDPENFGFHSAFAGDHDHIISHYCILCQLPRKFHEQ